MQGLKQGTMSVAGYCSHGNPILSLNLLTESNLNTTTPQIGLISNHPRRGYGLGDLTTNVDSTTRIGNACGEVWCGATSRDWNFLTVS